MAEGIDTAGVVVSVGAGITNFKPGDEVYRTTGGVGGGCAQSMQRLATKGKAVYYSLGKNQFDLYIEHKGINHEKSTLRPDINTVSGNII